MPIDYKYILFNIKNDKLSIFCILTHRYGKQKISINKGFMDIINVIKTYYSLIVHQV